RSGCRWSSQFKRQSSKMRAEILKYDVNAPREQGFSNQRMYPDTYHERESVGGVTASSYRFG
ncbi:MAG: hypothetical protein AB7U61_14520, partial [Methylocystis sp.]